jgi:hypothetical protein
VAAALELDDLGHVLVVLLLLEEGVGDGQGTVWSSSRR